MLVATQENSPVFVVQALDRVLEILRSTELYNPQLGVGQGKSEDQMTSDLVSGLITVSHLPRVPPSPPKSTKGCLVRVTVQWAFSLTSTLNIRTNALPKRSPTQFFFSLLKQKFETSRTLPFPLNITRCPTEILPTARSAEPARGTNEFVEVSRVFAAPGADYLRNYLILNLNLCLRTGTLN